MSDNTSAKGLAREIAQTLKEKPKGKTSPFDTTATVKRVEGGTAWVQIPGGVDETPVQQTLNAKEGDSVQVRVAGGKAWITGNGTNPPTDDQKAIEANETAIYAQTIAENAEGSARRASLAAEVAEAKAQSASVAADEAWHKADDAETAAGQAKTSAKNANEYAARALGNLSTVQSVTETLNWITQHGTMTRTTDTALDPTHVYFVQDNNGDYVVGNVHYSVVTEPKLADISTYYELSIDESLNNYVATHLAVTSEGLWIIPDAGGNKVLIATGQGSTYTTAGTYIVGKVNNIDTVLASFTADGVQIGQTGETNAIFDEDSFIMKDSRGNEFAHIGSPIGARMTDTFIYSNSSTFTLSDIPSGSLSVKINNTTTTSYTQSGTSLTITATMTEGDVITAQYSTVSEIKYYSLGNRRGDAGNMSMAEGDYTIASGESSHAEGVSTEALGKYSHAEGAYSVASGWYSHAEGRDTIASGETSHAEGKSTISSGPLSHAEGVESVASGWYSHAQNVRTVAGNNAQTAIGRYNDNQRDTAFEIGNGTSENSRSNAFTVDWSGNVWTAGSVTENNGTRDIDLTISEATIQKYVDLGMSLA